MTKLTQRSIKPWAPHTYTGSYNDEIEVGPDLTNDPIDLKGRNCGQILITDHCMPPLRVVSLPAWVSITTI